MAARTARRSFNYRSDRHDTIARMRYLAVAILAVVLFAAGFLAADLRFPDADAQGAWQYERFVDDDEMRYFLEALPSDCRFDWELLDSTKNREYDYIGFAYS